MNVWCCLLIIKTGDAVRRVRPSFPWLLGVCRAGRGDGSGGGGHGVRESGAQEACVEEEGGYLKTKITLIVTHNYKQILAKRLSHKKAMKLSGR